VPSASHAQIPAAIAITFSGLQPTRCPRGSCCVEAKRITTELTWSFQRQGGMGSQTLAAVGACSSSVPDRSAQHHTCAILAGFCCKDLGGVNVLQVDALGALTSGKDIPASRSTDERARETGHGHRHR